jgi:hypothetical protein
MSWHGVSRQSANLTLRDMSNVYGFRPAVAAILPAAVLVGGHACAASAEQVIRAERAGSCPWDGKQDVAPCIQQAINSAAGKGGTVHIPAGEWPIGNAIVAADNVYIEGDSGKTVLKAVPRNEANPVLLKLKNGAKNVIVKGITFDGGGQDFSNDKPVISGTTVTHVVFDDVVVRNTHGVGILLQGGTSNSGVQNSRFVNVGNHWKTTLNRKDRIQGLLFCCGKDNTHNFAVGNHFEDIGLDALQIGDQDDFSAKNNVFDLSNDQFRQLKSGDYPAGIFAIQSRHVTIADNVIRNAPGNGIDAPGLEDSTIYHNTIVGSGSAGIGIFIGYDKKTQAQNVSIVGNTVSNNVHWNLASFLGGITISGGTPSNITISGNTVTDTQPSKTQKYGVYVRRGTQVSNLKVDPDNRLSGNLEAATASDDK